MKAANRKVCGLHHYARQRILPNAAGVLHNAPQVHSSLAAKGGFFTTRAASIKTSVIKTPHILHTNPRFVDSHTLVMKNALSRIVKNACGVMKKPLAAAHEECAGAHNDEGQRRLMKNALPRIMKSTLQA